MENKLVLVELYPDGNVVASFGKGMTTNTQDFLAFLTAKPG